MRARPCNCQHACSAVQLQACVLGCATASLQKLTAADKAEGQAVKGLVSGGEVVADGIDDQAQELVFLRKTPNKVRPVTARGSAALSTLTQRSASRVTSLSRIAQAMYPTCFSAYLHACRVAQPCRCMPECQLFSGASQTGTPGCVLVYAKYQDPKSKPLMVYTKVLK